MAGFGARRSLAIGIAGNPNSGKTTLFNRLTGLRQKVGNYSGITIEKKVGTLQTGRFDLELVDLPGTYGLSPSSEEERVASEVILGVNPEVDPLDAVLCVVDSTCLERSLYLILQIQETGIPVGVVLNMADELQMRGAVLNVQKFIQLTNLPAIVISATRDASLDGLIQWIERLPIPEARLLRRQLPVIPTVTEATLRRQRAKDIAHAAMEIGLQPHPWSDRVDSIAMHKVWGPLLFSAVVLVVFQAIFSWARPIMNLIDAAFGGLGNLARGILPPGWFSGFIVDGVITGVGSVVIFLPQILIVFFFIAILENSGYLARAALVMDYLFDKIGLQGKSFLPLISSYACAVPGIMAARTIESKRDRLATIFVAPFMTCSARLPVYALLIGAFVPDVPVIGHWVRLRALTLLGLYVLGFAAALVTAWALKSTILRSQRTPFFLEIPPYRIPALRTVLLLMWDRGRVFLRQAGTVIMGASMVLWFLASFPQKNGVPSVQDSYAGRIGTFMEPAIRPLGFDWKIGVGLLSAQVARETIISTLATIYRVEVSHHETNSLQSVLQKHMTPLSAVSLMVFFAFALQCTSTLAVVRRETGNWTIPMLMFLYMNALAYGASFAVYQIGHRLALG